VYLIVLYLNSIANFSKKILDLWELKCLFSKGLQTAIPITFGITIIVIPETPLFAGSPILNYHSPEYVFMPHADIYERQFLTVSGSSKTLSSVSGQIPPFAKVAANKA